MIKGAGVIDSPGTRDVREGVPYKVPFDHCLLQVFLVFITVFYGGQVCA